MFRRPVVAALSLFLALGGIAPAFGRPGGPQRPAAPTAAAQPVVAAPAAGGDAIPPTDPAAAVPPGVDQFSDEWGFWGPRIRGCESGNGPNGTPDYRALNRRSGASGAYQFMDSTWGGRYGVAKARDASPAEQELAAYQLFDRSGTGPWSYSYRCWRAERPAGAPNVPLPASPVRPVSTGAPHTAAQSMPAAGGATPSTSAHRSPPPSTERAQNDPGAVGAVAGLVGRRK
jgi:hypothetical protein